MNKLVKRASSLPAHVVADRVVQRLLEAEKALGQAVGIDQVRLVMDVAAAQEVFAKRQKLGKDVIGYAHTIKTRALIRIGELRSKLPKQAGGRGRAGGGRNRGSKKELQLDEPPTNADLGLDKKTSMVAQQLAALPTPMRDAIADGTITLTQAKRQQQEAQSKEQLSRRIEIAVSGLYQGDFRALAATLIPDESVQLVLTDPPYDKHSVELYGAAAKEAQRVLRPGGTFLVYSGQKYLGEVIQAVTPHLRYWWTFALVHDGANQLLQKLGVRCGWKPILWFVKGTRGEVTRIVSDVISGSGREKDSHKWQQGESEAAELIERFTEPGGLVVDFFAGSGTVLAAAKKLDRRFTGFEVRADHIEHIAERLA